MCDLKSRIILCVNYLTMYQISKYNCGIYILC